MQVIKMECPICNKEYDNKKSLSNHILFHNTDYKKNFSKKISKKMKGRKITWGDKISKTKKELYKKGLLKHPRGMLGKKNPCNKETRDKIGLANNGSKNGMWKGDNVGYISLHEWIKKHKPKPEFCEKCKINKPYDLANISGKYKRDVNDFRWLCRKCHMKEDGRLKNLIGGIKK